MAFVRNPTFCTLVLLQFVAVAAQLHSSGSLANEQSATSPYGHLVPVNRDPLSAADWFIGADAFPPALANAFVKSGWALSSDFRKLPVEAAPAAGPTAGPDRVQPVPRGTTHSRRIVHASTHAKPQAPVWVEMPSILQPTWR